MAELPSLKCPICKKVVTGEVEYYPFCSDRCKLIDLGRWLGGKYGVPISDPTVASPETEADNGGTQGTPR